MQTSNFKIQLTGNTFHVGFVIELPLVSKPTVELRLAIHKYHLGIYYIYSIYTILKYYLDTKEH